VKEKGIADRVTFFGSLYGEDLEVLKQKVQAVILPSCWYENFPYALIESLQSGCVVVASDIGGIAERIVHQENGVLFESGNVHALAEAVLSLKDLNLEEMKKKSERKRSRFNGRKICFAVDRNLYFYY
jgi:glycosyltransferase involved in cell wall biosynthesis